MREIYRSCPDGYHVDHIIPMRGKLISGLHVEYNLQHLPIFQNLTKGAKFTPRRLYQHELEFAQRAMHDYQDWVYSISRNSLSLGQNTTMGPVSG